MKSLGRKELKVYGRGAIEQGRHVTCETPPPSWDFGRLLWMVLHSSYSRWLFSGMLIKFYNLKYSSSLSAPSLYLVMSWPWEMMGGKNISNALRELGRQQESLAGNRGKPSKMFKPWRGVVPWGRLWRQVTPLSRTSLGTFRFLCKDCSLLIHRTLLGA